MQVARVREVDKLLQLCAKNHGMIKEITVKIKQCFRVERSQISVEPLLLSSANKSSLELNQKHGEDHGPGE